MKAVQDGGGEATYVGVGATTAAGHHNGLFDFDEAAMTIALDVLHGAVKKLNG
jgi:aminobenzoyl-glutamate utilization protein A